MFSKNYIFCIFIISTFFIVQANIVNAQSLFFSAFKEDADQKGIAQYEKIIRDSLENRTNLLNDPAKNLPVVADQKICENPEEKQRLLKEMKNYVIEGKRLFYEESDFAKSHGFLEKGLGIFKVHPCVLYDDQQFLRDIFEGGLLLLRIYAIEKQENQTKSLLEYLIATFPEMKPEISLVPPEIVESYNQAAADLLLTFGSLEIAISPPSIESSCRIFLNGRKAGLGSLKIEKIIKGTYILQCICEGKTGIPRQIVLQEKKEKIQINMDIESRISIKDQNVRVVLEGTDPMEDMMNAAETLSKLLPVEKIYAGYLENANKGNMINVRVFEINQAKHEIALVAGSSAESPLDLKLDWSIKKTSLKMESHGGRIWTYVAAGIGAGLLGTAVYFNMRANSLISKVNSGHDSLSDADGNKTAAYVFYGAGFASVAASMALFFIESPAEKYSPVAGISSMISRESAAISINGKF